LCFKVFLTSFLITFYHHHHHHHYHHQTYTIPDAQNIGQVFPWRGVVLEGCGGT
jgi:hypothetical protein